MGRMTGVKRVYIMFGAFIGMGFALTSPLNATSYNSVDPLSIVWIASDPDGDPLRFILEYSADDGTTWQTITTDLTGTGYD